MSTASFQSVLQQFVQLPLSERQLLKQLLAECADQPGLLAPEPEVSIDQAAEILNVSPAFVARLLDRGELPRNESAIKLTDLLVYKKRNDGEAQTILDELTAQAQELKMGYE